MNFSLSNIWNQIKEQLRKLSVKTRKLILVLLCFVVAFAVIMTVILNNQPYETLFSGMTTQEAGEIIGLLQEMGVDYQYDGAGAILVPKDQELQLKAQLISQGYPKSGLMYETFTENVGLLSTDYEKDQYSLYAQQERMEAVIRFFEGVRDAAVTIAPGEDQRYVLEDDKVETTASVVVVMQNGGSPSASQVNGIQRWVAGGWPGLTVDNVTVMDGNGQEVSSSGGTTSQLGITQLKMQLQDEIEADTERNVLRMLEPLFGADKVRVSALATVDVDKKMVERITYIPSEDNRGVISSEQSYVDLVEGAAEEGGVAGTETNAEVPIYPGITIDGNEAYFTNEESFEYAVSQIKEQVQSDSGNLVDLTVSVAIDADPQETAQDQELRNLIATTAGIAPELVAAKIALFYDQFITDEGAAPPEETEQVIDIIGIRFTLRELVLIGAGVLVFLIIIVLILMLVGKGKKKRGAEQAVLDAPFAGEPAGDILDINLRDMKNTRERELKDQISSFADENPEISAQLIRTWLRGVDE